MKMLFICGKMIKLKQELRKNNKKKKLKGMMTLEMTLLFLIIMGILSSTIAVSMDLYQQCEATAQISDELKEFQAAESFRKAQSIKKTAEVLTHP